MMYSADSPVQVEHQAGVERHNHNSTAAASAFNGAPAVVSDASQPLSAAEAPAQQDSNALGDAPASQAPADASNAALLPATASGDSAVSSSGTSLSKPKAKAINAEKSAGSFSKINKLLHGFGASRLSNTGTALSGTAYTDAQVSCTFAGRVCIKLICTMHVYAHCICTMACGIKTV